MNVSKSLSYYLLILLFPVTFVMHGVNENFGLIDPGVAGKLLLIYVGITLGIAGLADWIFNSRPKAFFFSFLVLVVYFLFGVFKDLIPDTGLLRVVARYTVLLPLLAITLALFIFYLKRTKTGVDKPAKIMGIFLLINLAFESGWLLYNLFSGAIQKQDFGDYHHEQVKTYQPAGSVRRPHVFWLVFDEYAASRTLQQVWKFANPLDSMLRAREFLVIDSATSNYNFTHYSLLSTLDMTYLKELKHHSVVGLRDLARGTYSIYDNNVLQVFSKTGYVVNNNTIFNFKDHATGGMFSFKDVPRSLIDFQTLGGRVLHDIGWNFPTLFTFNKQKADSLVEIRFLRELDTTYDALVDRSIHSIERAASSPKPNFSLFHFMLPHEPFMYKSDGTVAYEHGFSIAPEHYIAQVKYTNAIITRLIDSILAKYRGKEVVIILQGDHGFKFREDDARYDRESCAILYAVYCSDKNYLPWYNTMSSVNGFRILFNKYFMAGLPVLPDTLYTLYYR